MANKKPTQARAASKRKSTNKSTKSPTAYETIESAIASTATLAAKVARTTEKRIRDLASSVLSDDAAPRATDLLVTQHRKVEKLFDRLESANGSTAAVLREIADDLSSHMLIEEKIFYPAVRKLNEDIILEGLEEHAMGRFALERFMATATGHKSFKARFKALQELMVNHHKEEERDLFPKVNRALSKEQLQKLGGSMKTLFDASVARGHESVLASFDDAPPKSQRKSAKPRKATRKPAQTRA